LLRHLVIDYVLCYFAGYLSEITLQQTLTCDKPETCRSLTYTSLTGRAESTRKVKT